VLREGGNAVDAAVCAALASFAVESPLTGLGAGGFMLVHTAEENVLLDFFVEVPGHEGGERRAELLPISVLFDETPQVFNIGAASCGVPGTAAGLAEALRRFGTVPMEDLIGPAVSYARDGVSVSAGQAYLHKILDPILTEFPESRALYAPRGRVLREGETFRFPDLADALERYGAEGPDPFYRGDVARALAEWVTERGGTLGAGDLAAYETVAREPVRARFRGREVLTNPPPSSGGILVALCLELLERLGEAGVRDVVATMAEANAARTEEFHSGLYDHTYVERFRAPGRLDRIAQRIASGTPADERPAGGGFGSTTHITTVDAEGVCAAVTCSNGTGSGMLVPGTGLHVNNMLGEEDLNPLGFHVLPPGR
jgi:gamma-glutamyltranspeptidase / glutathione hydrolase